MTIASTIIRVDAILIIVAIFSAVVLVFRYAVPPKKPLRRRAERLGVKGLAMRMRLLGKRCSSTTYGFGVGCRGLDFKKIFSALDNKTIDGIEPYLWENKLLSARDDIEKYVDKAKAAMRLSYTCGHVDGYPRVYLFCNELVCSTLCRINNNVFNDALAEFENFAALDAHERAMLPDVLAFCLCYILHGFCERERKLYSAYLRGTADGAAGKVDLDRIADIDYLCGLTDTIVARDKDVVMRLTEINGINVIEARERRKARLAEMYAVTCAVIDSLKFTDTVRVSTPEPQKLSRRTIMVCNIMPLVVIAVCAVITCVFVSARYAAVCVVVSIIVYGGFRLPVLIYAPHDSGARFRAAFKNGMGKLFNKKTERSRLPLVRSDVMSEIAYFGGESDVIDNVIQSGGEIYCDNHGKVTVASESGRKFGVYLSLTSDDDTLDLSASDVVFEQHRSVYRAVTERMEMRADIVEALGGNVCYMVFSAINRMPESVNFTARCLLVPERDRENCFTARLTCGAAMQYNDSITALAFDDLNAEYGGDLKRAFDKERAVEFGRSNDPALSGVLNIECEAFDKKQTVIVIAHGRFVREVERTIERALSYGQYEHDIDKARAFFAYDNRALPKSDKAECGSDMTFDLDRKCEFVSPRLKKPIVSLAVRGGGFTSDGRFVYYDGDDISDSYADRFGGRNIVVDCSANGILKLFANISDSRTAMEKALRMPNAFFIMEENGIVWSPTEPIAQGERYAVLGCGTAEYRSIYNGIECAVKCGYHDEQNAAAIEVELTNFENCDRQIDIAFMINAFGFEDIERFVDGVLFVGNGDNYRLFSSEPISEFCKYKEGFYSRGKYRASGFCDGGKTLFSAISVKAKLPENGTYRICFAITNGDNCVGLFNELDNTNKERAFERIKLNSSDMPLNFLYKWALYRSAIYCNTVCADGADIKREAIFISAVKYIDGDIVKRRITELLTKQSYDGKFDACIGEYLYIACAVIDYIEFSQDFGFLDKAVPYRSTVIGGATVTRSGTVLEHCLKSVDRSIEIFYAVDGDIRRAVCRDATFIKLLHKLIDLCKPNDIRRKKYIGALCAVAPRHAENVERLKSYCGAQKNEVDAVIFARALFVSGEYGRAYEAIKFGDLIDRAARRHSDGSARDNCDACVPDDIYYPLFYVTVTEMLLGLKFAGNRVNMTPMLGNNAPEIAFDVMSGDKLIRVTVDNDGDGEWRIRSNAINYSVNCISLARDDDADIVLYRQSARAE